MDFDGFHVNPSRLHFGEVTKLVTILSQHVALSGAYVPEITLCETFGAPCSDNFSRLDAMSKIYYDLLYFRRPCLRNHCVRNVWRVSPFASGTPRGVPLGHLGRQGRPSNPERFVLMTVSAANLANLAGKVAANSWLGCVFCNPIPCGFMFFAKMRFL